MSAKNVSINQGAYLLRNALPAMIETLALIWVAVWNGFPLLFFDDGWYIANLFHTYDYQKSLVYTLFMFLAGARCSLWAVVIAQAVLVRYAIAVLWKNLEIYQHYWKRTAAVAILCACSCVSWEVSYVMPDVFSAIQVIALFLLLFRRPHLSKTEFYLLCTLFVLSNAVHHSNYLLSICLLIVTLFWRMITKAIPVQRLILPSVLTLLSLILIMTVSFIRTGDIHLMRGSNVYIAGRLIEDGIVTKLLAEHCADRHYALCPYEATLPTGRGEFMFTKPDIFYTIGGWEHSDNALIPIILDCLRYYPKDNIIAAAKQTFLQLSDFQIANFIFQFSESEGVVQQVKALSGGAYSHFMASRQQQGTLLSEGMALLHKRVVYACSLLCFLLFSKINGVKYENVIRFTIFVFATAILNAALLAILSHAESRYQSRIIWLIPLCVLAALALYLEPSRRTAEQLASPDANLK